MDCYSIDAEVRKAHLTKDFCSIDDEYDAEVRKAHPTKEHKTPKR